MTFKNIFIAASVASLSAISAQAALTGTYNFGTSGNVASFAYNGTAIPGVTVGALTKVGVTTSSNSGNSRANGWSTGATSGSDTFVGTIDLGRYFEFTLTADLDYTLDMTSIAFGLGRSLTGPRQWEWRSSVNNYGSTIGTYTTTNAGLAVASGVLTNPDLDSSWTGNVLDLSGATYKDLTSVTFRIYGYNAEGSTGTGGLQGNLSFTVSPVPEPVSALLGGIGFLCLLRRRR